MTPELQQLFVQYPLHCGQSAAHQPAMASGHGRLDACLPGGGYPIGALTELLHGPAGFGEVSLLFPLLARLTRAGTSIAMVTPPYSPYAPALMQGGIELKRLAVINACQQDDAQWATVQLARSGLFGAVLSWAQASHPQLRRLQLAAEEGGQCLFLYRPLRTAGQASPAALRLRLDPAPAGLWVSVLKCRGPAGARVFCDPERPEAAVQPIDGSIHPDNDSDGTVALHTSAQVGH